MHLLTCQPCGLHSDNLSSHTGGGTGTRAVITYYGHSAYGLSETGSRLRSVRGEMPVAAWEVLLLGEAETLEPLYREIARDFGIEAQCRFRFSLLDKERADLHLPALIGAVYRIFGYGVVVTWELDSIVPRPASAQKKGPVRRQGLMTG